MLSSYILLLTYNNSMVKLSLMAEATIKPWMNNGTRLDMILKAEEMVLVEDLVTKRCFDK